MNLSLATPQWAIFFLVASFTTVVLLMGERKRHKRLLGLIGPAQLDAVFPEHKSLRVYSKLVLQVLVMLFLCLALLGPQWGVDLADVTTVGDDVLVVLDVSRSMDTQDISPSRLIRAKRELGEWLDTIGGERVGLVVFTGRSYLQCPLTEDHGAVRLFLDGLETSMFPNQGSSLEGLPELLDEVYDPTAKESGRDKTLLLVSDGEWPDAVSKDIVSGLKSRQVKVLSVLVGTEAGGPVIGEGGSYLKDKDGHIVISKGTGKDMESLAEETLGAFHELAATPGDLSSFFQSAKSMITKRDAKAKRQIQQPRQRYQWLVGLALLVGMTELLLQPIIRKR